MFNRNLKAFYGKKIPTKKVFIWFFFFGGGWVFRCHPCHNRARQAVQSWPEFPAGWWQRTRIDYLATIWPRSLTSNRIALVFIFKNRPKANLKELDHYIWILCLLNVIDKYLYISCEREKRTCLLRKIQTWTRILYLLCSNRVRFKKYSN